MPSQVRILHPAPNKMPAFMVGILFDIECVEFAKAAFVVRTACGCSQGNLLMQAMLAVMKFRALWK